MEVSDIASMATAMAQSRIQQAVQVSVLKKSLDAEQTSAMQLLDAIPGSPGSNPLHLGQNVDVHA
ncbi:MAG: YjfB family protein [Rhodocyclaceae bacterium]|nr:YjfB family protein [Rhodocyclaceae bacterium]MBX3669868.1 YjfB family protein [Rhodocyclaceae bacterium]